MNLIKKIKFSRWMKALGAAALVLGVIQGFHEPSVLAGIEDTKLWLALISALQGFFGKANTEHGTPDNPITPAAAAIMANQPAALQALGKALPALPAIARPSSAPPATGPNRYS